MGEILRWRYRSCRRAGGRWFLRLRPSGLPGPDHPRELHSWVWPWFIRSVKNVKQKLISKIQLYLILDHPKLKWVDGRIEKTSFISGWWVQTDAYNAVARMKEERFKEELNETDGTEKWRRHSMMRSHHTHTHTYTIAYFATGKESWQTDREIECVQCWVQAISEESSNSPKSILNSKFLIHPSQNIEKRRRGRKENREKEI